VAGLNRRAAIAGVLVAALGGTAAVALTRGDPPPADIVLEAWAPYWTLDRGVESLSDHGPLLAGASLFWYEARGATDVGVVANTPTEAADAFVAELRDQRKPVIPSIVDSMPAGGMAAVLADAATRAAHVDALMALVDQNDFDGIDIDYEQFAFADGRDTWDTTRPNWVAFITELGARLRADGKRLIVSIPPPDYTVYAYGAIAPHVDQIRIMAYDYSVSEPGPIAPLPFVADTIDAAKEEVGDPSKLVLGVALYGRNWVLSTTGTCPADAPAGTEAVNQRTVDELIARRGAVAVRDPITGESSFTYTVTFPEGATSAGPQSCTQTRQVHWVDAQGAAERVDLARRERLGGAALWALGFDDEATWTEVAPIVRPMTGILANASMFSEYEFDHPAAS
jgi:spore germination protein YaaH